jgi:hypothetical protein
MAGQQVIVSILADTQKFNKALKGTESSLKRLGTVSGKVAAGIGAAFAIAGAALIKFGGDAVQAAEEAKKVDNVLKNSIGNIDGLSQSVSAVVKDINDFADALGAATGTDDELIKSIYGQVAAMGDLGKTAGITGGLLDRTVTAALDVATATGRDFTAVSKALGKAIADPTKAIGGLTKAGITLTNEQKKTLQTFIDTNNTLGAQEYVLGLVEAKYGGAAEAGATASGKLKFAADRLLETLGEALLPAVEQVADAVNTWLTKMKDDPKFQEWLKKLSEYAKQFGDYLTTTVIPGVTTFIDFLSKHGETIKNVAIFLGILAAVLGTVSVVLNIVTIATTLFNAALWANPITWIVLAIIALIAVIVLLIIYWEDIIKVIGDVWASITEFFDGLFKGIADWFADAGKWLYDAGKNIIDGLLKGLGDAANAVGKFFEDLGKGIVDGWNDFWGIKSPSKKMKKLGQYINQGLALGLSDTRAIERAVDGVSGAITSNISTTPVGGSSGFSGGNTYNITVQAVAPNAEVGKAIKQAIASYENLSGTRVFV